MERYWLFLEKLPGLELYKIGEFETWLEVARWLARFHTAAECDPDRAPRLAPRVLNYDAAFYRLWFERANRFLKGKLDQFRARHERMIGILLGLPRTFIHGEFYSSNILVQSSPCSFRISPVDWEMAGVGPRLLDVAALAAGKWNSNQRLRIAEAYFASCPPHSRLPKGDVRAFDCCQLELALQWLGWSGNWSPPEEHEHDWLAEACELFERLD
jgi:Ser/Thr protein kinase RdoA (MazF antagonist)